MPRSGGRGVPDPRPVTLRANEVERLLGFAVSPQEIETSLTSLGFTVLADGDAFAVRAPYWRNDIAMAADIVEEIARVIGYDRVRAELPPVAAQDLTSDAFERETAIATTLAGLGYTEAISLSLQPGSIAETWRANGLAVEPVVEITNPLSEDQRWMRFSLAPALLEFAARDRAVRPYRAFELGHVFADAQPVPHESVHLTALHAGGDPSSSSGAFGRLKSDVLALLRRITGAEAQIERGTFPSLHPGKTAALRCGDTIVGYVGVVDPRLAHVYGVADNTALATIFVEALPERAVPHYAAPSKFPAVERDLAVVVPLDVLAGDLASAARSEPLARSATAFDEYRGAQVGDGKKSLALRIVLQSDDATLTDADADAALARITAALKDKFGAVPRT